MFNLSVIGNTKVANGKGIMLRKCLCSYVWLARDISYCNINFNKYASREARFMRRLVGNKTTGRKTWFKSEESSNISPISRFNAPKNGTNQRRIEVLNKLFMRYITDMMATGEVASELTGKGIEVSRVTLTPDFNRVNVFWLARGTENDALVEETLNKSAWQLRHELSQLRVMGVVPPIVFVKDKQYAKIAEVDRILATADFGEDYVPIDAGYRLKSEFSLNTPLSPTLKKHIEELEEKLEDDTDLEQPLPPMRMDVLGLKHADIMAKIKRSMKKSQAPHRQDNFCPVEFTSTEPVDEGRLEAIRKNSILNPEKEEFTKFLMKRKYIQKKVSRGRKNYSPELELYETDMYSNNKFMSDFMEEQEAEEDEDEDYINDSEIDNRYM